MHLYELLVVVIAMRTASTIDILRVSAQIDDASRIIIHVLLLWTSLAVFAE